MTPPLPPWSLHWSSNGELSPMDRKDLFLSLHLPGVAPCSSSPVQESPARTQRALSPVIYDFSIVKP